MRYLINLIDVDGTQLVFSSELALNLADALVHILRLQRKAITEAWHKARITVEVKEIILTYSPTDKVDYRSLQHDVVAQLEASAQEDKPCPPAPPLPYGWDFIDEPDPTWAEPYDASESPKGDDADSPPVYRGEAEITEAEAADLNAWLSSLPQDYAAD